MQTTVIVHSKYLNGSERSFDLQKVATLYQGSKEYRVYAPPGAKGDARNWLDHSVVHEPAGLDEIPCDDKVRDTILTLVKASAEWTAPIESPDQDPSGTSSAQSSDPRRVFVVHGRNIEARDALFDFLRSVDLNPIEWEEAIRMTGEGSAYVGQALDAGFAASQAAVVLLTGDDVGRLGKTYLKTNDVEHDRNDTPQARLNVVFEAGLAFGRFPKRTILVQLGTVRSMSDTAGRHILHMSDSVESRLALVSRLKTAGCPAKTDGRTDWIKAGKFNAAIRTPDVSLELTRPSGPVGSSVSANAGTDADRLAQTVNQGEQGFRHESVEHISVQIALYERTNLKGFSIIIGNERLSAISHVGIIISSPRSFDGRHKAFRDSSTTAVTRQLGGDTIGPSCSTPRFWLVRKEPSSSSLLAGNDGSYPLVWPQNDHSDIHVWHIKVNISAQTVPRSAAETAARLPEINMDLTFSWEKSVNKFSINEPSFS